MKNNKHIFFNPMYMHTKCSKCNEYVGITCSSCDEYTCERCHEKPSIFDIIWLKIIMWIYK